MTSIRELLEGFAPSFLRSQSASVLDQPVKRLTADSREVEPGSVYVAVRGSSRDGHAFLAEAKKNGAILTVGERDADIRVPDSAFALSRLASAFFGHPSLEMGVIGVTGTSGKTTTTYLLEGILEAAGKKTGVIGTVEYRYAGKTEPASHTTPGHVELQALLRKMRDAGTEFVVMEVSSHALRQHRVGAVAFDGAVFTNLSRDHLDYHADLNDYFEAKLRLFTSSVHFSVLGGKRPVVAIHGDDAHGRRILERLGEAQVPERRIVTFGMGPGHLYNGDRLTIDGEGIRGQSLDVEIRSSLLGRFNAENILAAVAVARGLGVPASRVAEGIAKVASVPGRMEKVLPTGEPRSPFPLVLVDYAHKPDALEKALRSIRPLSPGRLWVVFGCGGDRDRGKRPIMGEIAARLADQLVLTSDNPRGEDPHAILKEIQAGVPGELAGKVRVIADRASAIREAITGAGADDTVLVAGKGHEAYQIVGDRKAPFDDREIARAALDFRNRFFVT